MTRRVVLLAHDDALMLDVTGPAEVFSSANLMSGDEAYEVLVASADGGDVTTSSGLRLGVHARLDGVGPIDTLVVPGAQRWQRALEDRTTLDALATTAPSCRRLAAVCAGAFHLGAIGVLDGRRATTHWSYFDALASRFPAVTVERGPIFVVDGHVHTSAGVTAGIDLALALVEADLGPVVARKVAQYLVVFMQRPGGQAQFSVRLAAQAVQRSAFRELLDEIVAHPAGDYRLPVLADRLGYAERHLTRLFGKELGVSPARYVEQVRVEAARSLLEASTEPLETVARRAGFPSADALRRSFTRDMGVAPLAYRQRFHTTGIGAVGIGAGAGTVGVGEATGA